MKTNDELREQMVEFRKVFSNEAKISDRLEKLISNKNLIGQEEINSLEELRLNLVFGIDNLKISLEEAIIDMRKNDSMTDDDRELTQEFIMLGDEAIRVSNKIITKIDMIV